MEKLDKQISKRIWVTRYFMVIGIIVLHLPPAQSLAELGFAPFDLLRAFFGHGVFRATVPVLTVMSGFLVFRSGLHLKPLTLLSKKVTTVLVPLIIWNIPFVIAIFFAQQYSLLSHEFSAKLVPFDPLNWINALTGLFEPPANFPLNFLRDLFVVSLISPLYWLFLKKIPYVGLLVVLVIYYFNLEGDLVLRNSMLVTFYIGALTATQNWSLTYLDKYAVELLAIFIACCVAIAVFDIRYIEPFRLLSPFMIWPAMALLMKTKLSDVIYHYSKSSFFTFLAHGPILLILWIVFQKLPMDIPYPFYWFLAPPLTVLISIYASRYFRQLLPGIASFVLGGR